MWQISEYQFYSMDFLWNSRFVLLIYFARNFRQTQLFFFSSRYQIQWNAREKRTQQNQMNETIHLVAVVQQQKYVDGMHIIFITLEKCKSIGREKEREKAKLFAIIAVSIDGIHFWWLDRWLMMGKKFTLIRSIANFGHLQLFRFRKFSICKCIHT